MKTALALRADARTQIRRDARNHPIADVDVPPPTLTLAAGRQHTAQTILKAWRESKSENTMRSYEHDLERFATFFSRVLGISPILSVELTLTKFFHQSSPSAHEVTLYFRGHLLDAGLSPSSINRHLATLKSLSKLARMLGYSQWIIETPGVKAEKRRPTAGPTLAQIHQMLAARSDDTEAHTRDAAIVTLLFTLGLRAGELCGLRFEDCDLEQGCCWLAHAKNRRERVRMPLPSATSAAVRRYLRHRGTGSGPLIHTRGNRGKNRDGSLETRSLTRIIRLLGQACGFHCWPHALRHSSITVAAELGAKAGLGLDKIRAHSRHMNISTLQIYIDDHDRAQTQRTLADLVASTLTGV